MSSWDVVDDMIEGGEFDEDSEFVGLEEQSAEFDTTYILP